MRATPSGTRAASIDPSSVIGAAAHGERLQQPEEARLHAGPPVLLCIQRHRHHLAVGVPDQRQLRAGILEHPRFRQPDIRQHQLLAHLAAQTPGAPFHHRVQLVQHLHRNRLQHRDRSLQPCRPAVLVHARPYTARVLPHVETRESRADAALRRRGQTTRAREGPGLLPASDLGVLAQHHHLLLRVQRGGTLDGGGLLHAHPLRNDTRHLRPELPDLVGLALPLHRVRVRSRGVRASAVPRQELP